MAREGLCLAVLGAFTFPAPQGSQVFLREQAAALAKAGARVSILCYGRGAGEAPPGIPVLRIPRVLSPRSWRSGPHPAKPFADAALALRTRGAVRERGVDVIVAHNAEAALVALGSRSAPVLYVAHTLLEEELSAYAPSALGGAADRVGRGIERAVVRRVGATLALSPHAAERLRPHARGPVEAVPPGIATGPPPRPEEVAAACARHELEPGGFALYAGNLDAYQDVATLREVARRLPDHTVAVATHDAPADLSPLRVACVAPASPEEVRALTHGAAVALATRRRRGGFPIKILNYLEAGRAIVAREGQAATLRHGENALLLPRNAGAEAFAEATGALLRDPGRAAALGRAARETALREHAWDAIAERTLDLVERASGAASEA